MQCEATHYSANLEKHAITPTMSQVPKHAFLTQIQATPYMQKLREQTMSGKEVELKRKVIGIYKEIHAFQEICNDPQTQKYEKRYATNQVLRLQKQLKTKAAFIAENITPQDLLSVSKPQKLPRIMMKIVDEQIQQLQVAKTRIDDLVDCTDNLDGFKMSEIQCSCGSPNASGIIRGKVLFEKILGKNDPHYDDEAMAWGNCRHTIIAAAKRQVKSSPMPDELMARDFIQYAKNKIDTLLSEDLKHFGYSYADWYNHLPKRKQVNMNKVEAALNLRLDELTKYEYKKIMRMHYEAICKVEIQAPDGKPRMVCSIPDMIKYVMGPVTWHLEELMANKFQGYCGGKNLTQMEDEINEYIDQGFTKVVEGDGSAFDNTQDYALKEVERYVYEKVAHSVYHCPLELFNEVSHLQYKTMDVIVPENKKTKTLLTYHVLGTVFSGDCDTTLANTLRMALYNLYTNEVVARLKYGKDFVLFSKGDDFSVLYQNYVPDTLIQNAYAQTFLTNLDKSEVDNRVGGLGQICKFLDIGAPNTFKFCSLRSWYKDSAGHITLTRDPAKLYTLAKYSRKFKSMTPANRQQYLIDLAVSIEQSYAGLRVFDILAQAYRKAAAAIKVPLGQKPTLRVGDKRENITHDRITATNTALEIEQYDELLYNVQHRAKIRKINDDYWSTMQLEERIHTRKYTREEAEYINAQIAMEFDENELQMVLA